MVLCSPKPKRLLISYWSGEILVYGRNDKLEAFAHMVSVLWFVCSGYGLNFTCGVGYDDG